MSILIKGMEMPQSCSACPFCFGANNICPWTREYAASKGRNNNCPLAIVPPYGRLIDADALKTEVFAHDKLMKDGWNNMDMGMFTGNLMEVDDAAPAIIEADDKGINVPNKIEVKEQ